MTGFEPVSSLTHKPSELQASRLKVTFWYEPEFPVGFPGLYPCAPTREADALGVPVRRLWVTGTRSCPLPSQLLRLRVRSCCWQLMPWHLFNEAWRHLGLPKSSLVKCRYLSPPQVWHYRWKALNCKLNACVKLRETISGNFY